jgi:hypothetical protein
MPTHFFQVGFLCIKEFVDILDKTKGDIIHDVGYIVSSLGFSFFFFFFFFFCSFFFNA